MNDNGSDSSAIAPGTGVQDTQPTDTITMNPADTTHQPFSINQAHRALNEIWCTYFGNQTRPEVIQPPIHSDNLVTETNVPWGPDAHEHEDDSIRVYFQNMHGFARVNGTILSWASTMDFLQGLRVSLFAFLEPNLQWDSTLLRFAKDLQQRFFKNGQLVTSESHLQFPTSFFKPGGTCIGINGKWATRVTEKGVDPSGVGR
jgi:hypothetical protein